MRLLGNIGLSLRAAGPSTILVVLIASIALLGLFGDGPHAKSALGILSVLGGVLVAALAVAPDRWK